MWEVYEKAKLSVWLEGEGSSILFYILVGLADVPSREEVISGGFGIGLVGVNGGMKGGIGSMR